jgi:hypothetical protein
VQSFLRRDFDRHHISAMVLPLIISDLLLRQVVLISYSYSDSLRLEFLISLVSKSPMLYSNSSIIRTVTISLRNEVAGLLDVV